METFEGGSDFLREGFGNTAPLPSCIPAIGSSVPPFNKLHLGSQYARLQWTESLHKVALLVVV